MTRKGLEPLSKTIAVVNQKGGVGKTTTAVNLSACLANINQRVLLIDLDPQGNATSGLGLKAEKNSIYEILIDGADMKTVCRPSAQKRLDVVPADIRLSGAELELANQPEREFRLKKAIDPILHQYDYIFIDCPPSLNLLTVNALTACSSVLIPIQCEYYALEGVSAIINSYKRIKKSFNPSIEIEGILLTMLNGRTNLGLQVVAEVKKHFKGYVYSTVIPRNVRLSEAPSHGLPIHLYDPRSVGAQVYSSLAREFLARQKG